MSVWQVTMALAIGLAMPIQAPAQAPPSFTPAQASEQPMPLFPSRELRRGHEGWVLVGFTVSGAGTVEEANILDSSGSDAFEEATLETVRKWNYPPIPRTTTLTALVNFEFNRVYPRLDRRYLSRYSSVHEALDNGELEKAQNLVDKMFRDDRLTVFELAYTNIAAGRVAAERGDSIEQLKFFRRAMLNEGRWVEDSTYLHLLYAAVVLEIRQEDFASALRDYALLTKTAAGRKIAANLDEPIRMIRTMGDEDSSFAPPFMVADLEITVKEERPDLGMASKNQWNFPKRSIEEREFRRMRDHQEGNQN